MAIAWVAFSKIDEVAETPGEIVPTDQVLPVQGVSTDIIQAVKVKRRSYRFFAKLRQILVFFQRRVTRRLAPRYAKGF